MKKLLVILLLVAILVAPVADKAVAYTSMLVEEYCSGPMNHPAAMHMCMMAIVNDIIGGGGWE